MKIFTVSFLLTVMAMNIFGQSHDILNREVPRAGELITGSQNPGMIDDLLIKGEPGYDSLNMSFQGNWPLGPVNDMTASVTGDTLFLTSGGAVLVVDISDPTTVLWWIIFITITPPNVSILQPIFRDSKSGICPTLQRR